MSNTGKHRPPPVGGHVFTKMDRHRALHFGGRTEHGRIDHTYIFDLYKKVMYIMITSVLTVTHCIATYIQACCRQLNYI